MYRRYPVATLALSLMLAGSLVVAAHWVDDMNRPERWKKVEDAISKGLPQSAIKELDPIIESAIKDKAYAEAIKALARKMVLEGTIQGNKPAEKITRIKAEIAKAPKEMRPTLQAILGHWYWHYFQQDRWRIVQRTRTAASPGDDFQTWDLPRIFREIDSQFAAALADRETLKKEKVESYDALLTRGEIADAYRPTMFDFVAWEALGFYQSGEQAGAKAEDAFELDAAGPVLAKTDEFLKWKPESTDAESIALKAVKLYQELLAFHEKDDDRSAWLDVELARLRFGFNTAVGEEKQSRYMAMLRQYADAHARHEMSAYARFLLAEQMQLNGDNVEALAMARQGLNAFPQSRGGAMCHNLIQQILAKEIQFNGERIWNEPWPVIRVSYRNVTKAYFRAYQADWTQRLVGSNWRPEQFNANDRAMLGGKPAAEWSADLTATEDYKSRNEDIAVPQSLKPGFYFVFASPNPTFNEQEQGGPCSFTTIWVSQLALVMRDNDGNESLDGFVLKNQSGEPIGGATIRTWRRDNRNNKFVVGPTGKTDANGRFSIRADASAGWTLLAEHEGHGIASDNDHYVSRDVPRPSRNGHVAFFTDRAIYRPGQTIQFKGIALLADTEKDVYQTVANQTLPVVFLDGNNKEITRLSVKTNDFGSFSGSFTAPRDRLTGAMSLRVQEPSFHGGTMIRVEEYKRPQFEVTVESPKEAAKLNAPVTVAGKATAYTGAAVNGAKVKYRVTREVRYPMWWYGFYSWRMPPNVGSAQEIMHGQTVTDADGSFPITFTAKPDLSVPEKDEPRFVYRITADVTDATGETRVGEKTLTLGYVALEANVNPNSWNTTDAPATMNVITTTLNGDPIAAAGVVKIHALKQPDKVIRPSYFGSRPSPQPRGRGAPVAKPNPNETLDPGDPRSWPLGDLVQTVPFETKATGNQEITAKLPVGIYRAVLESKDAFGKPVTGVVQIIVVDPKAKSLGIRIPNHVAAPKWQLEPGQEFSWLWGTGYDRGRAFVEVQHRGKELQAFWTNADVTQQSFTQAVNEGMRGGFSIRVSQVRENRAYLQNFKVNVPWSNKDLKVKWERFTSKLEPGQKETWTAVVSGPKAGKVAAEFVAGLYDASLEQFVKHSWIPKLDYFHNDSMRGDLRFENRLSFFNSYGGWWEQNYRPVPSRYRHFPDDFTYSFYGFMFPSDAGRMGGPAMMMRGGGGEMAPAGAMPAGPGGRAMMADMAGAPGMANQALSKTAVATGAAIQPDGGGKAPPPAAGVNLGGVSPRKNLTETAFFLPHLTTDEAGNVRVSFQMPDAVTRWKFFGFAHDRELRSGFLDGEIVTAKELMVRPNPPRFLREGDQIEFTVKVNNQSPTTQKGRVKLMLKDARTEKPVEAAFGLPGEQTFDIASKGSQTFSWKLTVPDGQGPIIYTAVAATDRSSDGEEGMLPVLAKRILVQESIALPIRGNQTKTFDFRKLREFGSSDTLKSQSLTVQMVSQPAWYAVLALPYLMENPHECSEQIFNRMYANALARHVAKKDPKIRRVFDLWKESQPDALKSPLHKNQDLKSVMIEETPWLRDADRESEARKNVGILFDDNRLNDETARSLAKLAEMQNADGLWPWFPGGRGNEFITLYVTTGFGRLRNLGVAVDTAAAVKSLAALDAMMERTYRSIRLHSTNPDNSHLSTYVALYLYGRSFFIQDKPIAPEYAEMFAYWKKQAKDHWLKLAHRQSQGHIALAMKRLGDRETATAIGNSIRERSVSNEEMGTFWRDTEQQWWWYRAPIETQALMVELFDEVAGDAKMVEDCKVWLLKQKQTQNWKTTKATADAVYALLLRGDNLLSSDALVEVKLGDMPIRPENVEAGTGFYQERFGRGEVKPAMGTITVKKSDPGVSWGSVHWSYLEDIAKITPHSETPLTLEKALFRKVNTAKGPTLEKVDDANVQVGDEVVVRVVLRTDRDLEYVHLKDHRGSGTEPVSVLSQYKIRDGFMYYESTKDTASHFFIDYLPKGTYVFEYSVRVQLRGQYQTGMANVQCMYAPEFSAHSQSIGLKVK